MTKKVVLVSGCFDLMHAGHVHFLQRAAVYGDLYVGIGSDRNISRLKGRDPLFNQQERAFYIRALSCVKSVILLKTGTGVLLDFVDEFRELTPDVYVVNEDGDTPSKREFCEQSGVEYVVLDRDPPPGCRPHNSADSKKRLWIPHRISIAGGWMDQPYVSKYCRGPLIVAGIEPSANFLARSGMAGSTRRAATELWGEFLPVDDPMKLAKVLFAYENPPGSPFVSGTQDAIGVVFPALNRLIYDGDYWPTEIDTIRDESILQWLERLIYLIPLSPRGRGFHVLEETNITRSGVRSLARAAEDTWDSITRKDATDFGKCFRRSFEAQVNLFPNMMTDEVQEELLRYESRALGWKLSGAGGGGYLILISEIAISGAIRVKIRRE